VFARLKHNAQARVEFDRGARLILSDSPADFGSSWHDWYAAQLVRREAEAVLKSSKVASSMSDKVNDAELRRWLEGLNDEDLGRYKM